MQRDNLMENNDQNKLYQNNPQDSRKKKDGNSGEQDQNSPEKQEKEKVV